MIRKYILYIVHLLYSALFACNELPPSNAKNSLTITPEKVLFLNQLDLLDTEQTIKRQLDSANITNQDLIGFCQLSLDIDRKTTLIQIARSHIPNNLQEENHEYWAGILYDLRRFIENVSLLKQPQDKIFMDVGSGNGEKLYVSLCLGFEKAIGIEYSKDLVQIAQESLQDFEQNNQIQTIHQDAFKVPKEVYEKADFIYLYSPIKDNTMMANLTFQIMQNMKDGAKLLEVRFVYRDELVRVSGLSIPHLAGLFALKKHNNKFYYAEYDHYQTKWKILE